MDDINSFLSCVEDILRSDSDVARWKRIEEALLQFSLTLHNGNRTKAASYAGISNRTLRNKTKASVSLQKELERLEFKGILNKTEEKTYEEVVNEASNRAIKKIIVEMYKSSEVYHLRGLFNLRRVMFKYPQVQEAVFNCLTKFDGYMDSLTRNSAEDLREDIEIFIETGCKVKETMIHKRIKAISTSKMAKCHSSEAEWEDGLCLRCFQNEKMRTPIEPKKKTPADYILFF